MNKPVGIDTARIEPVAPVVLVPKPPPIVPAGPHFRKTWLFAGLLSLASHQATPMAASTASDNSPANSQVFRKCGPAGTIGGGFGTRTTGATGSIRAVSIPTGLFMAHELRLRVPPIGTLAERHGAALIRVKSPETRRKGAKTARRARPMAGASRLQLGIPIKIV